MAEARYRLEVDWNGNGLFDHTLADIYPHVMRLSTKAGRDYRPQVYGRAIAGTLTAKLRDDDGIFARSEHDLAPVRPGAAIAARPPAHGSADGGSPCPAYGCLFRRPMAVERHGASGRRPHAPWRVWEYQSGKLEQYCRRATHKKELDKPILFHVL